MHTRRSGLVRAGLALLFLWPTILFAQSSAIRIDTMTCEGRSNPVGVDVESPWFAWTLAAVDHGVRGLSQSAWQIIVAGSPASLDRGAGYLWDSGKVESGATSNVHYDGRALQSGQQYWWKLRAWDQDGQPSAWSQPQSFTMGVLQEGDWGKAKWIDAGELVAPASLMLRSPNFEAPENVRRAVIHVTGMGHYELTVNGVKVGNDLMAPGWTDYNDTVIYNSYDVTDLLRTGAFNSVGIMLGNGYFNVTGGRYVKLLGSFGEKQAIALLEMHKDDGTIDTVGTDRNWSAHTGPITFSCVFGGEDHDARLELKDWDAPLYTGRMAGNGWSAAREVDGPAGSLRGLSAAAAPVRGFETLEPIHSDVRDTNTTIYDMGQNASIMPRLKVTGRPGDSVRIRPSELLAENGEIRDQAGRGNTWWTYTLGEQGTAEWFPKFFYRGGRYLEVIRTPASEGGPLPRIESIQGVVVHASSIPVGEFECSNRLFNEIHSLIRWAQRSNMFSVLTDCPHREKLGWLEQNHLNGPSLRYEFDMTHTSHKMLNDIRDAQNEVGMVPNIAPQYTTFGWWGDVQYDESPEWGSAAILVPYQQWLFRGDTGIVEENYDVMAAYMDYLARYTKHGVLTLPGSLGDWYDLGPKRPGIAQLTPDDLPATAIFYQDARAMQRFAKMLDRNDDAQRWQELALELKAGFNAKWLDADKGSYATGSQTANAFPLALGMVPEQHKAAVLENLVADIREKGLTSGEVGHRYLLLALAENGRSDVVFDIHSQSERPGYGYIIKQGGTALTEAWNANPAASQNHFMLGHLMEWFYRYLVGIQPEPEAPGFRRFTVAPTPVGDVKWARATYNSASGAIDTNWKLDGGRFTLNVIVPVNTTAEIHIPGEFSVNVQEGGKAVTSAAGVELIDGNATTLKVGSGRYAFTAERP